LAPRKYEKRRRAVTTDATRRRILEASLALHRDRGFQATSWQDIAERADVAVGTVYYHFPTFAELVPACGGLAQELTRPPGPAIFESQSSRAQRIDVLVREVFAYYARATGLQHVITERHQITAVDALAREMERSRSMLIRLALGEAIPASVFKPVEALMDFRVWDSFRARGLRQEVIVKTIAMLIQELVSKKQS
jgi:AcrR family transcriptional regulator